MPRGPEKRRLGKRVVHLVQGLETDRLERWISRRIVRRPVGDEALRRSLGEAARCKFAGHYELSGMVDAYETLMSEQGRADVRHLRYV